VALWNLQHTTGLYSPTRLWHTQHYNSYSVYSLLVVTTILQRFPGFADVGRVSSISSSERIIGRLLVLLLSAVVGDKEVESNVTGWDTDSVCRALTAALWLETRRMDEKRGKEAAIRVPKRQETQLGVLQ
jgi:hypothetical protein